ncbi:hypothetical protein [Rhodococcoides fascians]
MVQPHPHLDGAVGSNLTRGAVLGPVATVVGPVVVVVVVRR